jgi:predicted DNA-binding protein with PD1-like motif
VRQFKLRLPAGVPVHQAISKALEAENIETAIIEFEAAYLSPLVYVIPAHSPDSEHVAWYSERRKPTGVAQIEHAVMSFGYDNGAPFLHCHGIWVHGDGFRGGGHLMTEESTFARDAEATVWVVAGARFERLADTETNFSLLTPVAGRQSTNAMMMSRALLVRIKPNSDIHTSIEATASAYGIRHATIYGVCSLIDCDFVDGRHMASFASEAFIKNGRLENGMARLSIGVAALDARVFEGEIVRGGNVTCIACELLVVESRESDE